MYARFHSTGDATALASARLPTLPVATGALGVADFWCDSLEFCGHCSLLILRTSLYKWMCDMWFSTFFRVVCGVFVILFPIVVVFYLEMPEFTRLYLRD